MHGSSYRERIYEQYASNFQDASSTFDVLAASRWGKQYTHHLKGWMPAHQSAAVLDVACGYGRLLHLYKSLGILAVSGVDISPQQVELARQVTPNVVQGNALEFLKGAIEQYDVISAFDIIEHFYKDEVLDFLAACNRALKPGGRLILQTPNAESPWGSVHRYNDFTHEVGFNPNSLTRLLSLSGFESIESREVGPIAFGNGPKSLVRFLFWQAIRAGLRLWNLAETGSAGSGVFTRVFLIAGVKK